MFCAIAVTGVPFSGASCFQCVYVPMHALFMVVQLGSIFATPKYMYAVCCFSYNDGTLIQEDLIKCRVCVL